MLQRVRGAAAVIVVGRGKSRFGQPHAGQASILSGKPKSRFGVFAGLPDGDDFHAVCDPARDHDRFDQGRAARAVGGAGTRGDRLELASLRASPHLTQTKRALRRMTQRSARMFCCTRLRDQKWKLTPTCPLLIASVPVGMPGGNWATKKVWLSKRR